MTNIINDGGDLSVRSRTARTNRLVMEDEHLARSDVSMSLDPKSPRRNVMARESTNPNGAFLTALTLTGR